MKNNWYLVPVVCCLALTVLSGCGNSFGGDTNQENPEVPQGGSAGVLTDFKFNLSGAKAIAALDADSSASFNARAATISGQDVLVKINENAELAQIIDLSAYGITQLPNVQFIARSPGSSATKDLYIYFASDLINYTGTGNQTNRVNLGKLFHVKENGSCVAILSINENNTWSNLYTNSNNDPVIFDNHGNMFFIMSESSNSGNTNTIYKYNPATSVSTPLTAPRSGISYEKIAVSSDGSMIIAKASIWNNTTYSYYLRVIPVNNPDGYENIAYSSSAGGGGAWITSFVMSNDSKTLIFSGSYSKLNENNTNEQVNGLFKVSLENLRNIPTPTPLLWTDLSYGSSSIISQRSQYVWNSTYLNAEGKPDYNKIMQFFYNYALSPNIEFRYNGKTDTEALASLKKSDWETLYSKSIKNVLVQYWYRKGTNTLVTFNEGIYNFDALAEYDPGDGLYKWKATYFKSGQPDSAEIMKYIYTAANSNDIEFRFNDKTDEEALKALTSSDLQTFLGNYSNMQNFINTYCYMKGTDTKVDHNPKDSFAPMSGLISTAISFGWIPDYLDADENPDYDKIMEYFYSSIANSENIEFRYNGKTDKEALLTLTQEDFKNFSSQQSSTKRFIDYCFRKGTNIAVSSYNSPMFSGFSSMSSLTIFADGSLWGISSAPGSSIFCQLLDSNGNRDYYVPEPFIKNKGDILNVLLADDYFYYGMELYNASGMKSGNQKIYRFSINNPSEVTDLFSYIDRNPDRIELDTYTLAGEYLYFSGAQGTKILSGKINVNSGTYEELGFGGRKITTIMSY
ncbi:hypothetical protein [Treponema primitia]|uniref:hypothetical protein n=1 Tax=Treponema primitia TaxID=88058 RepID=UPI0018E1D6E3|nr:hypothetical protein [Treponema primitia]